MRKVELLRFLERQPDKLGQLRFRMDDVLDARGDLLRVDGKEGRIQRRGRRGVIAGL